MAGATNRVKLLYRRVNTRTYGVRHGDGGKAKWERNTKDAKRDERMHASMHKKHQHGLDYTPLFKFLLSRVGQGWDQVHSQAVTRLDKPDPIFWLVAEDMSDASPYVRTGENSYFSGLFVTEGNKLAVVDPELTHETIRPFCACCTHTFNGLRFTQSFNPD